MVIVAGTMQLDPADRDAFLQSRADAVKATLTEPGCIEYSFSADGHDPGLVRLFEVWENQDALSTHLALLAENAKQQGAPAASPVKKADILQYNVSSHGPLQR
jgi:quinol monooxygenase YgiN